MEIYLKIKKILKTEQQKGKAISYFLDWFGRSLVMTKKCFSFFIVDALLKNLTI